MDSHLTDIQLLCRAQFRSTEAQAKQINDHLRVCPDCNTRYREIAKNEPSAPAAPELVATQAQNGH